SVIRCETANCSSSTTIRSAVPLGAVALGSLHTLLLAWDDARNEVKFQLDNRPPVVFNPQQAGYPNIAPPNVPFRQIAVRAGPAAPGDRFTGSITATFENVKTM